MMGDFDSQAEIKKLLNENQQLLKENNMILHKMRRASAWASVFRFLKYVILICVFVYVYFQFVSPNTDKIKAGVSYMKEVSQSVLKMKEMYEAIPKEPEAVSPNQS